MGLHISLAAEQIATFYGMPITNSYLTTLIVMVLLIVLSVMATRKMTMIPGNAQLIAESIVGGLYDFFSAIAGKHIKQFFPLVATLFLFILVANWVGLLPGVGTIGFTETAEAKEVAVAEPETVSETAPAAAKVDDHAPVAVDGEKPEEAGTSAAAEGEEAGAHGETKFVPLFRAATADLNMTLALALVSVIAMQYFGFRTLGAHYASRFVNFKDPIMFGVGILELASDISKVVSFAFRLFGNIFAGEVLLAVLAFLIPFIVPLPFLFMELFVGVVQALVFSMLSTAFFNVAVSHGEEEHAEAAHA
ncbi:F0F1 ATP synthase subunit A [Candidatus Gottesmanbacteria bacterium]|nr:F0F1 ATP synthase subunit A [Candidatus Gottesmanbacteria bacterium]